MERTLAVRTLSDWQFLANYTHITARDSDSGIDLLRRPDNMAKANLHWTPDGPIIVSMGVNFTGTQRDKAEPRDRFIVVDLRGSYEINDGIEVFVRVENLF